MNSGELATDPGALKHIEVEHPTRFPGQSTNSKHRTLLEAILLISLQRAKVSGSRADTRRYENKHTSAERLARRATPARVGIVRTRMEAKSDRGSPRDHRRSGEPMDQPWQSTRERRVASPSLSWCPTEAATRAIGSGASTAGARSRSVRLPRASLDRSASRPGDQARIWRELSSDPLLSPPFGYQAQSTETGNARAPA